MDLQARARQADLPGSDVEVLAEDESVPIEDDPEAEAAQAARDLLTADLSDCDMRAVLLVLNQSAWFAAELDAVGDLDDVEAAPTEQPGDDADTTGADPDVAAGPVPGTDAQGRPRATGGSVHVVSPETPGARPLDEACLAYTEQSEPRGLVSLGPCTDTPWVSVELDLAAGTAQGELAMDVSCPGWFRCNLEETSTGSARGSFGPLPITIQPDEPPVEYPFPAHHYYPNTRDWVAAGPVTLDLAIAGSYPRGEEIRSAEAAAAEQAWVTVELVQAGQVAADGNPSRWRVRVFLEIDQPGDLYPRWDLAVGLEAEIAESGVPSVPRP